MKLAKWMAILHLPLLPSFVPDCVLIGRLGKLLGFLSRIIKQLKWSSEELLSMSLPHLLCKLLVCWLSRVIGTRDLGLTIPAQTCNLNMGWSVGYSVYRPTCDKVKVLMEWQGTTAFHSLPGELLVYQGIVDDVRIMISAIIDWLYKFLVWLAEN
jgi:hypothetical protein